MFNTAHSQKERRQRRRRRRRRHGRVYFVCLRGTTPHVNFCPLCHLRALRNRYCFFSPAGRSCACGTDGRLRDGRTPAGRTDACGTDGRLRDGWTDVRTDGLKTRKFQTAVYPPRMARIGAKLWENAFQTIPVVQFFDVGKKKRRFFFDRKFSFWSIWPSFGGARAKRTSKSSSASNFAPDTPILRSVPPKMMIFQRLT